VGLFRGYREEGERGKGRIQSREKAVIKHVLHPFLFHTETCDGLTVVWVVLYLAKSCLPLLLSIRGYSDCWLSFTDSCELIATQDKSLTYKSGA
jgi:hypothetical protein